MLSFSVSWLTILKKIVVQMMVDVSYIMLGICPAHLKIQLNFQQIKRLSRPIQPKYVTQAQHKTYPIGLHVCQPITEPRYNVHFCTYLPTSRGNLSLSTTDFIPSAMVDLAVHMNQFYTIFLHRLKPIYREMSYDHFMLEHDYLYGR